MQPSASIIIATKNRKDDLRAALTSALAQQGAIEVVVADDGSTDGTADMVAREFPAVRLERSPTSRGYIAQRNHLAEIAAAPVVISIDDDATFASPVVVQQVLGQFSHPRIGAVAIPFINVRQDQIIRQCAPNAQHIYAINTYIGTAHALRRDVFRAAGGYKASLIHQGEEAELCIRMLQRGYIVRLGWGDPIYHFESPRRNWTRMHYFGRRNNILFAWYNVPLPHLLTHLPGTTLKGLGFGLRQGGFWPMLCGTFAGYGRIFSPPARQPVSPQVYRLFRSLAAPRQLTDIESNLPPLQ